MSGRPAGPPNRCPARSGPTWHAARVTFQGAILDVDGVLVDSPHEQAWRDALRELMEGPWASIDGDTSWSPDKFTSRVYQERLSGRPRLDGARAALEYFQVPDLEVRALGYADRKQDMVVRLIEAGEFTAFDDALRFVWGWPGPTTRRCWPPSTPTWWWPRWTRLTSPRCGGVSWCAVRARSDYRQAHRADRSQHGHGGTLPGQRRRHTACLGNAHAKRPEVLAERLCIGHPALQARSSAPRYPRL